FKISGFAFGQKTYIGELTQIPGDFFQLLMYGNYFDSIYDFSSLKLDFQAYEAISAGLGAKIPLENGMSVNFGLSGAYIASFTYFNLSMDSMAFESDSGYLRQIAYGRLTYGLPFEMHLDSMVFNDNYSSNFNPLIDKNNFFPPPGNGFDLNIGLALNLTDEFLVELSYNHAISRIYWNNGGREYTFALKTDSLNLANIYGNYSGISEDSTLSEDDIIEALLDSLLYYDLTPTLAQNEQLITILEPEINVGFLYHMKYLPLNTFIRYTQGFKNTAFSSVYPKFTAGIQYTLWNWLLLESAAAFGGREGFQFNVGIGINTDRYTSDINVSQDRGLIYSNKGLHLSLNGGIHSSTYGVFTGTVIDSATKEPLIAHLTI
ncbi:hypothetical protein KAU15_00725, partial [candidate division WOR-3 bacterium]|nr:hypothetical protein [candidate division WOR-3 bacterium]